MLRTLIFGVVVLTVASSLQAQIVIPVAEDVMASGFFQGENLIRGYADESPIREAHRVSSNEAFGVGRETVYMTFEYDFASLGQVQSATLHVASVDGGFGAEGSSENPFGMAVSAVSENPLTAITDDTTPGGTIAWDDFFANNILDPAPEAITTVTGIGELQFDVTSLVSSWADGSNDIFALALHGKADTLSNGEILHGIANNSFTADTSHFLTVVVPEPSSFSLVTISFLGLLAMPRKLRRRNA